MAFQGKTISLHAVNLKETHVENISYLRRSRRICRD